MEQMRVLVANDPRVYREVISDALGRMRPLVEVVVAAPEELDGTVARVRPHLVVCSRRSAVVEREALAWVVLYPDGEDRAELGGGAGVRAALLAGVKLADLLLVVDETELLCRSGA